MFAASGLLFWTITYMQVVLFMDPIESQSVFVLVMISAMIPGVAAGGALGDYFGGYKGRGVYNSLILNAVLAILATLFSLSLSICFNPEVFVYLLWLFFFFGSGCMPISAGIIVSCVPKETTNSGSALYCIF